MKHICDFWFIPGPNAVLRVFELTGLAEKLPFRKPGETSAPTPLSMPAATQI